MVVQGSLSDIDFPCPFFAMTAIEGPVPEIPAARAPASNAFSAMLLSVPVTSAMSLPLRVIAFR
jgi:hypothetical protein